MLPIRRVLAIPGAHVRVPSTPRLKQLLQPISASMASPLNGRWVSNGGCRTITCKQIPASDLACSRLHCGEMR